MFVGMLSSGESPTLGHGLELLLREAGGGIVFGLVLGYVTFRLLRSIDHYQVEVLRTLAAVMGATRPPTISTCPGRWQWSSPAC